MKEELTGAQEELQKMRIRDRVHKGIKTRLSLELPYIDHWPQAMALGAQP